jgi:ArsR family transcriptional regulator, arsenate/arsenite/antimonite-responsive transcriptional repressor
MNTHKKTCAGCFRTLADETRIRIITLLREEGKTNVSAITKFLRLSQPTISHHLRILSDAGILSRERQGKEVLYAFRADYPCSGCGIFGAPIKL